MPTGNFTNKTGQFDAFFTYTGGDKFSVLGGIDATGRLSGTWGSGAYTSGGGRWVMNRIPSLCKTPPPPPPPTPIYSLTEANVDIETGNDNKEAASQVEIGIYNGYNNILFAQKGVNTTSEFAANQPANIGLTKSPNVSPTNLLLDNIVQSGQLRLRFHFLPKPIWFGWDAWAITSVKLKLKFTDQFGKPHPNPRLNGKNITLVNVTGMLWNDPNVLDCYLTTVNSSFTPTTSAYRLI